MTTRLLRFTCVLALVACGDDGNVNPLPDAPPPNIPPQVTITAADFQTVVGRVITLRAVGDDPDGDELTFEWTQTAGPAVTLVSPTSPTPSYVARAVGVYKFTVTASDGLRTTPPIEVKVTVFDIDGGEDHTLALKPDGTLLAWGDNSEGQLGDPFLGSERRFVAPVCSETITKGDDNCDANPFTGAIAIATGRAHSLALRADGTVWAWGAHDRGQLGVGDQKISGSFIPLQVCNVGSNDCTADPLTDVVHIAAGFTFSVALKSDGTVVAWGSNGFGELGNGDFSDQTRPVQVCAVGEAGAPGFGVGGGFLCTEFLTGVTQLTAGGGGHSIAILDDDSVVAWGHNKSGQVGNGDSDNREVRVPVPVCAEGATAPCPTFLTDIIAVDAWSGHSLALKSDGSMLAWGSNDESELGARTTEVCSSLSICSEVPVPVCLSDDDPCTTPFTNVASFAAGRRFSVALTNDGKVFSWGDNVEAQQGDGDVLTRVSPGPVCAFGANTPCTEFLDGFSAVAAGSFHALALRNDGLLFSWGDDDLGQLGNNDVVDARVPVVVGGF